MKKILIIAMLLVIALIATREAQANPFISGHPSDVDAYSMEVYVTPFLQQLVAVQKNIHEVITNQIEELKKGKSLRPLWGLLLVSLAYGIFHVLAPGHGKVIVGSYFLGNDADWRDGVWAGLLMAIGHTVTAIGIVFVLYLIFGLGHFAVLDNARYVELAGYGMIAAIGLMLLWRAFTNEPGCAVCGHNHHHGPQNQKHDHAHDHKFVERMKKPSTGLFAAASLVPCSGSMIILLFTLSNKILWAGVLAVIMIALGMWLTISAIGFASMFLRRVVVGDGEHSSKLRQGFAKASRVIAALIVIATGGLLFAATFFSMMG